MAANKPAPKKSTMAPLPSMAALHESLQKTYGSGRVVRRDEVKPYTVVSTGVLGLDLATVAGGYIMGRTHEIRGIQNGGKTTLCINGAVQHQLVDTRGVAVIDMEGTFDYDWAEAQGLDTSPDRFLHTYPEHSEDVSDQIKRICSSGVASFIWVDSIGGMESKTGFEKSADESNMGKNAQIISRMVKNCAALARMRNVTVVFNNQLRANVGSPQGGEISAGPNALKYNTTFQWDVRRGPETSPTHVAYGSGDGAVVEQIAQHCKVRVTRSKVGPMGRTAEFWINNVDTEEFGPRGIRGLDDAIQVGINCGAVQQDPGGYYWVPSTKDKKDRIHGREKVVAHLLAHPEEVTIVRATALEKIKGLVVPEIATDFDMEGAS